MKIVRTSGTTAVIKASWLVVQRASANADWARSTRIRRIKTDGTDNQLVSGAMARHLGNGLWEVSSARPDGSDVEPAITLMTHNWTPDLGERERRKQAAMATEPSWYIKETTAIDMARAASDKYGLPQTVYKTSDTCGWAHTNPFSSVLRGAQLDSTWLPANYFR